MTKDEALTHLKVITEAFGPEAGIELDQKAWSKLHTAINAALAQPEQTTQQEPEYVWPTVADYERDVGFETNQAFRMAWNMARTTNKMLGHTSAPQRKWVWLTNGELADILKRGDVAEHDAEKGLWHVLPYSFAKAVEIKLKEKNT